MLIFDLPENCREAPDMTVENPENTDLMARCPECYEIACLEDEIRADQLCGVLLGQFHTYLLEQKKSPSLEAGSLARGADYFLRNFLIDQLRQNIFHIKPEQVRKFGGHWYILNNLEPNLKELESFLLGIDGFYRYCAEEGLIEQARVKQVGQACSDLDYYAERIESFHRISGDEFVLWDKG